MSDTVPAKLGRPAAMPPRYLAFEEVKVCLQIPNLTHPHFIWSRTLDAVNTLITETARGRQDHGLLARPARVQEIDYRQLYGGFALKSCAPATCGSPRVMW